MENRESDSLVDQALQELWEKHKDALPWNDAGDSHPVPPHVDPDDPRWADYAEALRGHGYPEASVGLMLAGRGTPDRDEDFTGFLVSEGLAGETDPTRADWDRYWSQMDEPPASGDPDSEFYAAFDD